MSSKAFFSSSAVKRAPPPILALLAKPISRFGAMIAGRSIRKMWQLIPQDKKIIIKEKVSKHSFKIGVFGAFGCFGGIVGYESKMERCSITGKRRFILLDSDKMKTTSMLMFKEILAENDGKIVKSTHPVYDKISSLTNRILKANSDLYGVSVNEWTVTVINNDEEINACVLPSGNIIIYTGMLRMCRNDDQLGIVLSHEISHVLLNHVAEKLSHASLGSLLLFFPMTLIWTIFPSILTALFTDWLLNFVTTILIELPFSRDMEKEADSVGLKLAAKACFDIREAPIFWHQMGIMSQTAGVELPGFFSTHPPHNSRELYLAKELPEALEIRTKTGCSKLTLRSFLEFSEYAKKILF